MRIALTRERGANEALRPWLPEEAEIVEVPLTATTYVSPDAFAHALVALREPRSFQTLVVTSARAASYAPAVLTAIGSATVASVGVATTTALGAHGVRSDVIGDHDALSLAPSIKRGPVLLLGARDTRPELVNALAGWGFAVTRLVCYETVALTPSDDGCAQLREADVVLIGAPSTWRVARDYVGGDALVVVPGATTAAEVRRDHPRVLEQWGPALREHLAAL